MISARTAMNAAAATGLAGAAFLYRFSPQEHSFYPRCPFYALTHHYCPGCGATRAVAELLHGHVAAAVHFNAAVKCTAAATCPCKSSATARVAPHPGQ